MANRVDDDTKIKDVKVAATVVASFAGKQFLDDSSVEEVKNTNGRLIEVTPLSEGQM